MRFCRHCHVKIRNVLSRPKSTSCMKIKHFESRLLVVIWYVMYDQSIDFIGLLANFPIAWKTSFIRLAKRCTYFKANWYISLLHKRYLFSVNQINYINFAILKTYKCAKWGTFNADTARLIRTQYLFFKKGLEEIVFNQYFAL